MAARRIDAESAAAAAAVVSQGLIVGKVGRAGAGEKGKQSSQYCIQD